MILNISKDNKAFLWMPGRTGSNHAVKIFSKFGFKTIREGEYEEETELNANHFCGYFIGHERYDFISTARNPFNRFLSIYKFNHKDSNQWNIESFREYFIKTFTEPVLKKQLWPFGERVPNYFVRLENLNQDYSKIPFIKKSNYFISGKLSVDCNEKVNSTKEIKNPQDYYSEEMIKNILTQGKKYFQLLNYNYPY